MMNMHTGLLQEQKDLFCSTTSLRGGGRGLFLFVYQIQLTKLQTFPFFFFEKATGQVHNSNTDDVYTSALHYKVMTFNKCYFP